VKGHGRGSITLKGYGRGYYIWPLRVVIEHMSNPRELRALGAALKPNAHELAKRLLRVAADQQRDEGDPVPVPPNLLSEAALLLLALAGPQRGRPPKASTLQLLQLYAEGQTKRGAARAVARETGEPFDTVRRRHRLRSKTPSKPKRKRGGV
jgi:hypothetical protein